MEPVVVVEAEMAGRTAWEAQVDGEVVVVWAVAFAVVEMWEVKMVVSLGEVMQEVKVTMNENQNEGENGSEHGSESEG